MNANFQLPENVNEWISTINGTFPIASELLMENI